MTNQSRKELLKTEDVFTVAAGRAALWMSKRRSLLLGGGVTVVVLLVGSWGAAMYRQSTARAAGDLFAEGLKKLHSPVAKTAAATAEAKPGADAPAFATEKDKWVAARSKFQEAADRAGGKGVGLMARYYVADLADKLGEADVAESTLKALRDDIGNNDSLAFLAADRYAYLREAKNDPDGAIAALQPIADDQHFYADYAQFHQARLHLAKGDKANALTMLKHIDKTFHDSALHEEVQAKLIELGEKPDAPSANVESVEAAK